MTYTIKKGDTLTSIAKAYNTTVDALAEANKIKNKNLIYAGSTLSIPGGGERVSSGTVYSSAAESGGSAEVKKAAEAVAAWQKNRPAEYDSAYSKKLDSLLSELSGRSFEYDAAADPVYKSYRDSYAREGRLAMLDTLGKATAQTGGYSNSYAVNAAGGAYNGHMQKLGDVIPELYEAAYGRYTDEGDSIADEIKLISSLDNSEWEKYNDAVKNYLSEGGMLMDNYAGLSDDEYDRMLDYAALLKKYSS